MRDREVVRSWSRAKASHSDGVVPDEERRQLLVNLSACGHVPAAVGGGLADLWR